MKELMKMSRKVNEIHIGDKFDRWTVIGTSDRRTSNGGKFWLCQCSCNKHTIKEVSGNSLNSHTSKSCGCLHKEITSKKGKSLREDLTGQRFGLLTVIEHAGYTKATKGCKAKNLWKCLCDCGKETVIMGCDLKMGHTKSCGCINSNDLTGRKFGKLQVIKRDVERTKETKRQYYICECDCGTINSVRGDALLSGGTDNCGCTKHEYEDLVGQQFGELIVISHEGRLENSLNLWKCRCSCGNEIIVRQSNLKSGNTTSCGCIKISKGELETEDILNKYNINYIQQYRFQDCKYKYPLYFDFYLPDYNCCIEYDGEQHFKPVDFASKGDEWAEELFKDNKKRDKIKNTYCKNQNIPLIRIPYWEKDNLECFLFEQFNQLEINIKVNKVS